MCIKLPASAAAILLASCANGPSKVAERVDPCADKQVHLHVYGTAKEHSLTIGQALEAKGLGYCFRSNRPPGSKQENFVIHSADQVGHATKDAVIAALTSVGTRIESTYRGELGMHSYTEGNVGVYLFSR